MKIKLITQISVVLLIARLKQTMVAAFGVTSSITMFIALLSFMAGLNDLLDNLILNLSFEENRHGKEESHRSRRH